MKSLVPLACAALLFAGQAPAQEVVGPEEFRAYAEGYTLYFERDGEEWGAERFNPDGSVRWRYPDGTCLDGVWRGHDGQVCFYYGPGSEVLCWEMRRFGSVLMGRLLGEGEDAGLELTITGRDKRPLICGAEGFDT